MKNSLIKVSFLLLFLYSLAACKDKNSSTSENPTHHEDTRKIDADKKMMTEERLRLEKEKQEIELEKLAILKSQEQDKEQDKQRAIRRLEKEFEYASFATVKVSKTFFHAEPDYSTRKKSYLVQYDSGSLTQTRNGFGYINFYNSSNGKSTSGWISLTDLEPQNEIYD
jgi:hypothetical protein